MSLRAFHLLFIAASVVLMAFCGAWAVAQYRIGHHPVFMVTAVGSIVAVGGLGAYGTAFQRKTRNL
jgi:hypothetical protein